MAAKSCVACGDEPKYSQDEVDAEFAKLKGWELVIINGVTKLRRAFVCKNWLAAIDFINKASVVAEECQHHPDIALTSYRNVEVLVYTHSNDTLTRRDFELAGQLGSLPVDYSPKWAKENPSC